MTPPMRPADAWDALVPAVQACLAQVRAVTAAAHAIHDALDPDPAPDRATDPAAYALWARRNRGTGPPVGPPGARR